MSESRHLRVPESVQRWQAMSRHARFKVRSHYAMAVVYPAGALLAWAGWTQDRWVLMQAVAGFLAFAFFGQASLLVALRSEPDVVCRRMTFAACNSLIVVLVDAELLFSVAIALAWLPRAPNWWLLAAAGGLVLALVADVRAAWRWRAWLPRNRRPATAA